MKQVHHTLLYFYLFSLPIIAIEPPNKTMPVPPSEIEELELPSMKLPLKPEIASPPREAQDAALPNVVDAHPYVGIKLSDIPDELALHLGIEKSEGALVRLVAPESPAKIADVQEFDIIQKIDGAVIRGHDCLCGILRHKKLGDKLDFSILRRGQKINRYVTLGSRPENLSSEGNPDDCEEDATEKLLENVPERYAPRIRKLLEQNSQALGALGGNSFKESPQDDMLELRQRTERAMAEILRLQKGLSGLNQNQSLLQMLPQNGASMQMAMKSRISVMDSNGRIEINRQGDKSEASVYDSKGNLEWSGPYSDDEDKKSIPPKILKRLLKLNLQTGGGSHFEMKFGSDE
jgi:hypothetical protein